MAEDGVNLPGEHNIEHHIVTLFEKFEALKNESRAGLCATKLPIQVEVRTLEFWRSVISECLASFIYVFIVCGAAAGAGVGASISSILLSTALASGFAMTSLTQCFGHISGAHINPAVTIAMGVTKNITFLRTVMFIFAQCGGGIAGAAFLYGVSVPGYQGNLSAAIIQSASIAPWEKFGVEFILTFVVVFSYLVSMKTHCRWMSSASLTIGATYSACTFVSRPYLNPARSLGPSFVLNKWENHWVYWLGPMVGGVASGLIYEYIFNPNRQKHAKDSTDGDSSSIHSDEDTYDDLDKPAGPKFHGSSYNTYRPAGPANPSGYCPSLTSASLYSAPPTKLERVESLYGGTKSLYCKSPPLTRANLNRSQSVYTKSNGGVNRDIIPKPGPLVPTQSLYPMRLNQQQNYVQNQNVQNQMQQHSESFYGVRGVAGAGTGARPDTYGNNGTNGTIYTRNAGNGSEENPKNSRRPESMYGLIGGQARRGQSAQSDDSSYSSYHGSTTRNNNPANGTYLPAANTCPNFSSKNGSTAGFNPRPTGVAGGSDLRQSPPTQLLSTASNSSSYHHSMPQHSPSSHY